MKTRLLVLAVVLAGVAFAQENIPSGTILAVRLNSGLNTKNVQIGREVTARLMQDVPASTGIKLRAGSKVIGQVLAVSRAENQQGAGISLKFDRLRSSKREYRITTDLRAVASALDVDQAQIPAFGPDRGTPKTSWTTEQIGGDVVYRGGGPVTSGSQVVGTPVPNGVLVNVSSKVGTKCRGELAGNPQPQALWVFSADACGVYGYDSVAIAHAGRSDPVGEMQLTSSKGNVNLRIGTGLLLRVE